MPNGDGPGAATGVAPSGYEWVQGDGGTPALVRRDRAGNPAAELKCVDKSRVNWNRVDDLLADRAKDYADPVVNHRRIAGMWRSLFNWDVTPERVAMAMICVKLSREFNAHKDDNCDDIDGYVEIIRRIEAT